jgi:hypothetical protein
MAGWYEIRDVSYVSWDRSKKVDLLEWQRIRQFRTIDRLEMVDVFTKTRNRRALTQIARYFRKEFGYDFTQFCEVPCRNETLENTVGYIFPSDQISRFGDPLAAGGCCFRLRTDIVAKDYWALQWVWLHPYERNRGLLTKVWPEFVRVFGDFHVEHPLSPAMRAFLEKQKNAAQIRTENAGVN